VTARAPRRLPAVLLAAGLVLLAGAIAWPHLLAGVIAPAAQLAWLLLRLTFLSVDQHFYWFALLLALPLFLGRSLLLDAGPTPPRPAPGAPPAGLAATWRRRLEQARLGAWDLALVRGDLLSLVVSCQALQRDLEADFRIREALRDRQLPLPDPVHAFLFPPPPPPAGGLRRLPLRARAALRGALRAWTGREAADQRRAIAAVLSFLETSLELERPP
jgi:hypothetical protein